MTEFQKRHGAELQIAVLAMVPTERIVYSSEGLFLRC